MQIKRVVRVVASILKRTRGAVDWVPIDRYSEFWDVPRLIVLRYKGVPFLLDSPFVEEDDDYSKVYEVYRLPDPVFERALGGLGGRVVDQAERLGIQIRVSEVAFDKTHRRAIREGSLTRLALWHGQHSGMANAGLLDEALS